MTFDEGSSVTEKCFRDPPMLDKTLVAQIEILNQFRRPTAY